MVLELQEHIKLNESGEFIKVKPRKTDQLVAEIPIPHAGAPQDHRTVRSKNTRIKFVQFPINISNARTVHKLQGRTIENLMIASFDYRDNWIYVALSRVTTLKGLFLMKKLVLRFSQTFRQTSLRYSKDIHIHYCIHREIYLVFSLLC